MLTTEELLVVVVKDLAEKETSAADCWTHTKAHKTLIECRHNLQGLSHGVATEATKTAVEEESEDWHWHKHDKLTWAWGAHQHLATGVGVVDNDDVVHIPTTEDALAEMDWKEAMEHSSQLMDQPGVWIRSHEERMKEPARIRANIKGKTMGPINNSQLDDWTPRETEAAVEEEEPIHEEEEVDRGHEQSLDTPNCLEFETLCPLSL